MTESVSRTKTPPMIGKSISVLVIIAATARTPPMASAPVSPMKLHGGYRCARHRWGPGGRRDYYQDRDALADHRRRLRPRDALGHDSVRLLQAHREAGL